MGYFLVESQRQRRGMRPVGREAHRRTGAGVSRAAAGLPAPCFHERLRDKHGKRPRPTRSFHRKTGPVELY